MMIKQSNKGIPCTYCDNKAIPDTDPPVCEEHKDLKKKATKDITLKELEVKIV